MAPPLDVIELLHHIISAAQTWNVAPAGPLVLDGKLTPANGVQTLVPLAGLLLEYPASYVPSSTQQEAFLGTTPLDVYEVVLCLGVLRKTSSARTPSRSQSLEPQSSNAEHSLLKFSCPSVLDNADKVTHPKLSPISLCRHLHACYNHRVAEASTAHASVYVKHHTEVRDRVAL